MLTEAKQMANLLHSLLWDVTDSCNLRCMHCYNADKYFHRLGRPTGSCVLNTKEALSVVDRIADIGFDHIHLLGGEPLCRPDVLEIIARARARELRVTINTNGTLLNSELNAKLIDQGVAQIVISLDGCCEATNDRIRGAGTFRKVTANILELTEQVHEAHSALVVLIAFTMMKSNLASIVTIPALAAKLGVQMVDMIWLYECGNACLHLEELQPGFDSPQEYLDQAVSKTWSHYPQVGLQLDTRPRFAAYLSRKYGIRIVVNPAIHRCRAGEFSWLLEADGYIHPCGVLSTPFAQAARSSGALPLSWINCARY